MKEGINRIKARMRSAKERMSDYLRRKCAALSEGKRIAVIVGMILFMSIGSVYLTVSSIYRIGQKSGERSRIEHIRRLQLREQNDSVQSFIHKPNEYAGK